MAFRYSELLTIAYSDNANTLSLWKFAKTYARTSEKMRIMSMAGTLDAYATYEGNNGSLVHSDQANPVGGMMMIANGSSNEFYREVQKNRDEHAVLIFDGKRVGFTKVIRPKKYALVFKDKFAFREFRLVIENYKMPIWVTNYQSQNKSYRGLTEPICEAVAYWLQRMETALKSHLEPLKAVQFEIEIVVDETLLKIREYEIKDIPKDSVFVAIEINAPKIKLHIPYDFLYIIRLPDNSADKLLMKAVLKGIVAYTTEAGKPVDLTEEQINQIVETVVQPSQAKMILFADPTRNARLDNRHLPTMRYLQESDISYILDNLVSYLPAGYAIPATIESKEQKIKLCDDIVVALLNIIESKIKDFNGELLLQWLIRTQEKCVQIREFREILIPAKIACFSTFAGEVKELTNKEDNLVTTSHSLRTLIEFVAAKIPSGSKWPNHDDIDELLALVSQVTNWGAASEAMRFNLSDPEMGLLPSGRIGMEKTMEREILEPYSVAKSQSDVFQYIENFETNYLPADKISEVKETEETKELDTAFKAEFGITLTMLSKIIGILIKEGFRRGDAYTKIDASHIKQLIESGIKGIAGGEVETVLHLLSLVERSEISKAPTGFKMPDIFPWHFTRPLSYLRRPLIRYVNADGNTFYYYGFRHLMMYIDNLYFLLYTGKLPERNSAAMSSWIGSALDKKGKPYRNSVRDWFKKNTRFTVVEYEVTMKPGGHLGADKDYGDIDVLVIDHSKKIVYSVECKNSIGARNVHEMKSEMDMYLGREGNEKKAKALKHVERDKWLKMNKDSLKKFGVDNPDQYEIKSFILTADEIPFALFKERSASTSDEIFCFFEKRWPLHSKRSVSTVIKKKFMDKLDLSPVFFEALEHPEYAWPNFFIIKQKQSVWSKGVYLTALNEVYDASKTRLEITFRARQSKNKELKIEEIKLPVKEFIRGDNERLIDKTILTKLHLAIHAAGYWDLEKEKFTPYQILSFVEYALWFMRNEFQYVAGLKEIKGFRPRTKSYFNYKIAQNAPFFDFPRFKAALREINLAQQDRHVFEATLEPFKKAANEIVTLWNDYISVIVLREGSSEETEPPELLMVEFHAEELNFSWWNDQDLFEVRPTKLYLAQDFAYYAAKISNLISNEILLSSPVKNPTEKKNFINDMVKGIQLMQEEEIKEILAGDGRREDPYRNWVWSWFRKLEYQAERETLKGTGHIDLKVIHPSIGTKVIEFKGWWNDKRKEVIQQTCKYLTEFEEEAFTFIINHSGNSIIEEYKSIVENADTGIVGELTEVVSEPNKNYKYYRSTHNYNGSSKVIYHFIFPGKVAQLAVNKPSQ